MASWEEVVSWVSVGSSVGQIRESSQRWQAVFGHLETLQSDVARLQKDIERASWAGHTTDALTKHLDKIATTVQGVIEGHRRIVAGLQEAAGHLDGAVSNIPVPSWVKDEATQRKTTFESSGQLTEYQTNEFYNRMPWTTLGGPDPTGGEAEVAANLAQRFWHWYHNYMETADSARQRLMDNYAKDATTIGTGGKVASPQVAGTAGTTAGTGAGAGTKGLPSGGLSTGVGTPSMPTAGMTPSMGSAPLSTTGLDSSTLPPDPASTGLSGSDLGSSGLAGAPGLDTSGLGTSGLGLSGLGTSGARGGGGLAGLKPLGAGGAGIGGVGGIGSAGLGPSVSPEEMIGETPGAPAAGRVAGGAAAAGLAGTGAGAMGMMPGGAGAGMPIDSTGQTETKLIEDDKNIFGPRISDRDLPGDVIG